MGLPAVNNVGQQGNVNIQNLPPVENHDNDLQPSGHIGDNSFVDVANEFENVGMEDIPPARESLQNANVGPDNAPKSLRERLRNAMPARHTFGNWFKNVFKSLGRAFMSLSHVFRGSHSFSGRANELTRTADCNWGKILPDIVDPTDENGNSALVTVSYKTEEIGTALGLRNPALKPFAKPTYPSGHPRLDDIEQDPTLQDCWFLSTIGSILATGGAEAIERLITVPDNPNEPGAVAKVRLGDKYVYEVPYGEIRGNGGKSDGVSHSAPWVQILEQAMQMHLIRLAEESGNGLSAASVRLAFRNPAEALNALLCTTEDFDFSIIASDDKPHEVAQKLKAHLHGLHPTVLASDHAIGPSLVTGISPGHAVSLVDVDLRTDTAILLDPYGKIKPIAVKDLVGFTCFPAL